MPRIIYYSRLSIKVEMHKFVGKSTDFILFCSWNENLTILGTPIYGDRVKVFLLLFWFPGNQFNTAHIGRSRDVKEPIKSYENLRTKWKYWKYTIVGNNLFLCYGCCCHPENKRYYILCIICTSRKKENDATQVSSQYPTINISNITSNHQKRSSADQGSF